MGTGRLVMMELTVSHREGMAFVAKGPSGHEIALDAAPEVGGSDQGARPMELILAGLGGCSGMDVVSILRKMRVNVDRFEIRLKGRRAEEHPKVFTHIDIEYAFWGSNLEQHRSQIEKAVKLSQDKYCSVAAMLRHGVELSYHIVLHEAQPAVS